MSEPSIWTTIIALSGLDAIQGTVRSRIDCSRCYSEGPLVVLVRLLVSLLEFLLCSLLICTGSQRKRLLDLVRLTLLWLRGFARSVEQLLCSELLAQFVEFGAAHCFLFLSLTFRRLKGFLGFQCGIGQVERGEWVVGILALRGTRVEGMAPYYTRSAGVRFDATSAKAAHALA